MAAPGQLMGWSGAVPVSSRKIQVMVQIPDNMGDFNEPTHAHLWAPNTTIELFNVPWTSDYRDVVDFPTNNGLDAYLDARATDYVTITRATALRPFEPIRVSIPFNNALRFNYVRVKAPAPPIEYKPNGKATYSSGSKTYYYFINDMRHIAPNTTELMVQLDVWSTYRRQWEPGYGYVERGHVGIANQRNFSQNGRKYLTVPEGLDIGNEYNVISTRREKIAGRSDYNIIIWSTTDLIESGGSVDNPKMVTAQGSGFGGLPNAASAYVCPSPGEFRSWLRQMQNRPWVTQGIISVQAVPPLERYGVEIPPRPEPDRMIWPLANDRPKQRFYDLYPNWRENVREHVLPSRYRHLNKFFTSPYCVIELTTNTGAPVVLKPEQWGDNARIGELPHLALPSPRVVFFPANYNKGQGTRAPDGVSDGGEFLDVTTGIYDFPTFSVVNNGYMSFMASNRNSISYQHSAADWSQQKALRSADVSYSQSLESARAQNSMVGSQISTMNQMTNLENQYSVIRAGAGAAQGLVQGAAFGGGAGLAMGAVGAAGSAVNEVIAHNQRNQANSIQGGSVRENNRISQDANRFMRDSNRDLAQFAAKGDYAQALAGINAKVQDAKLTQNTTSGQIGGEVFNLVVDQWGIDIKIKMLDPNAMRTIGEFWLMYGYAVNAYFKPATFSVMSRFSYWKFQQFYIASAQMPESYKQTIRGIFEKGVTVWRNPDHIGNTDPGNNTPVESVYYE